MDILSGFMPALETPRLKLRKLNLQLTLAAFGAHCEYVEYQHGTVNHLHAEHIRNIAQLHRRKLVVKHNRIRVKAFRRVFKFLQLTLAHVRSAFEIGFVLYHFSHDLTARGLHEFAEFLYALARRVPQSVA